MESTVNRKILAAEKFGGQRGPKIGDLKSQGPLGFWSFADQGRNESRGPFSFCKVEKHPLNPPNSPNFSAPMNFPFYSIWKKLSRNFFISLPSCINRVRNFLQYLK